MSKKNILLTLALICISTLTSLFIAEAGFRVLKPPLVGRWHQPCFYVPDEQYGYVYKPNTVGWMHRLFEMDQRVPINSIGFHDIEHAWDKLDGKTLLLTVGDSFVSANHVAVEETWSRVLENELNRGNDSRPFEVVNVAIGGGGTDKQLALIDAYSRKFKPSYVILAFNHNDYADFRLRKEYRECYKDKVLVYYDEDDRQALRRYVDEKEPTPRIRWLYDNVYLFRALANWPTLCAKTLLGDLVGECSMQKDSPFEGVHMLYDNYLQVKVLGKPAKQFREWITQSDWVDLWRRMIEIAERRGFRIIVAPIMHKRAFDAPSEYLVEHLPPDVRAKLTILDLRPPFKALLKEQGLSYADAFFVYDGHYNATGNRLFAKALARAGNGLGIFREKTGNP